MFKFIGFHSYPLTHMCLTKVFNIIATFCSGSYECELSNAVDLCVVLRKIQLIQVYSKYMMTR